MKLNPDCIRDILMDVEAETSFGKFYEYSPLSIVPESKVAKYDSDTVLYHIKQCELSGYFTDVHWYLDSSCLVIDITPIAHEFLANIREDNNWNKTKEIAKSTGSNSLDVLKQIATGVVSAIIKSQLGL